MLPKSHKIMKGKMYWRTTLKSHFEGAFWFLPGFTLKTTMESKKFQVIHQFFAKCISTKRDYALY